MYAGVWGAQMLNKKEGADVEFVCGDHSIHCHRAVLATRSEYFRVCTGDKPGDDVPLRKTHLLPHLCVDR